MTKSTPEQIAQEIFLLGGELENYTIDELVTVLKSADDLYYNDIESFLTDEQYDTLRKFAEKLEPYNSYFTGIGSDVRGGKIKLPYTMGSLDQVDVGEIVDWVKENELTDEDVIITEKLDGTSAMVIYGSDGKLQIAYSRGNGREGADITRHLRHILPTEITTDGETYVIRGEVIISKENFPKLQQTVTTRNGQQYKNARNMVSGLMNASKNNPLVYSYIHFLAYDIINHNDKGWGKDKQLEILSSDFEFDVPSWIYAGGCELDDEFLANWLEESRANTDYEIDGLVIDVCSAETRQRLNPTRDTLNPAYAIKYKVADASNQAVTEVVGVEWNVSKHGYLKPRVKIKPVELVGVTVQHATGFNAKFINDNGIGPGAKIRITRSGDVIPFIQEVVEAANPQMPGGKWEWNETGVDAITMTVTDEVAINRMTDFFTSIDAPHLKKGNVAMLYQSGLDTIEKVIKAPEKRLIGIIGENGRKIYAGLHKKLGNVPMYTLMGAHASSRGIGIRKMKKLYQAFGDSLMYLDQDHGNNAESMIDDVEGFDYKTAMKIVTELPLFRKFVEEVEDYVTFADTSPTGDSMKGESVVFTGFRDKDLAAEVEAQGGRMQNGVSGKTTILVASNPNSNSGKMKKAREKGVRIMGIEEFKELL